MTDFYEKLFTQKRVKTKDQKQVLEKLYTRPKRDSGKNMPHFQYLKDGTQQADLLSLPHDGDYKYALVVVDNHSRQTDAEPLKGKTPAEVLEAFKAIYKRGILKEPKFLQVDGGSEFKGELAKYFNDKKIPIRVAKPARHRQQAIVERRNQTIGRMLFKKMTAKELLTGETSREWTDDLPKLISAMNKYEKKKKHPIKLTGKPVCQGDSCEGIPIGTKVRVALHAPEDVVTGKRLHGKFRATDIRWDPEIRTVTNLSLRPDAPPMYTVSGHKNVAFTKNQLQIVHKDEKYPEGKEIIKDVSAHDSFRVEKIVGKKKEKGKWYVHVKWVGYPSNENTWELRSVIKEDVPHLLDAFEKAN